MRHIEDWDAIQEQNGGEFERATPGGYIARIARVEDVESKEYLRIEWEFDEGKYKGTNQDTFNRAGFWPSPLIRSYKQTALGFFKGFKTCVEVSNPGYVFDDRNVQALVGKVIGVVLGDEEYQKNNGTVGKRTYVDTCRSVKAIRGGDFKVPELKKLAVQPASSLPKFTEYDGDDGDMPF